jgi:hypothetical protein
MEENRETSQLMLANAQGEIGFKCYSWLMPRAKSVSSVTAVRARSVKG